MDTKRFQDLIVFVAALWVVRLADTLIPIDFNTYGLMPRTLSGLLGILTMPFLHGGWGHLMGNTIPLCILLFMLASTRTDRWEVIASIIVLGGGLLWCFGRSAVHVGASGLVYGLVAFLLTSGFFEKNVMAMIVSLGVGFLYGSTLFFGVLPSIGSSVSWDGHLFGALAGVATAYALSKFGASRNDSQETNDFTSPTAIDK
jgi:membrane associated rhomboid family serine protease